MSDIKYAYPLILNKVASPQYATPVLRRARLLDWLNDAANCRATVIAADAGYGKTTLLWQWEREVDFPCYWYKLDRTDRDWTFHISYLIEAISKRHRGFGRRAHSMLQQMSGPGTARPGVAAYLLAEMHQRLTEPCTFIIDDWQYVNAVTEVRGLWNQILRDAPATCRFVFASRVKPKLQFARFKTHGGYAELQTDALRFTEPEIAELFRDVYNDPLDASELSELERRTEGWAASLQLVEVSLRERSTPDERRQFIRSITATRDSDLFDFLAEEVLDQQPTEMREFLLSTSILHQITPEVAERLTGANDGRRSLVELESRGLFTSRVDDATFRYHNLFRDFLEKRLRVERAEAEVAGLHIHAASYFETAHQWPEAIHHYLRAGLQRQAARLIARYGEELVAEGRLGLVDEWLRDLPRDSIRGNARLSLLQGEALGIRGEWDEALSDIQRARSFFEKKGDRRLQALAYLKLSTVHSNFGDPVRAAEMAQAGLAIVPEDARVTKLRLEGNLAITKTWLTGPLEAVLAECLRIAREATALGLEHYAAIAYHNAGDALLHMGRYCEAVEALEQAAKFWSDPPTSPFADCFELVIGLLSLGQVSRARQMAADGVIRTRPWPRPHALAQLGAAAVHLAEGRLTESRATLSEVSQLGATLGEWVHEIALASSIELLYLSREDGLIREAHGMLDRHDDPRDLALTTPAKAIAAHAQPDCRGACLDYARELADARKAGAVDAALVGEVKLGTLAIEHRKRTSMKRGWDAIESAVDAGLTARLKPWIRRYAAAVDIALVRPNGAALLARLAAADPDGWRGALVQALDGAPPADRQTLLGAISLHADRHTIQAMARLAGNDVAATRRQIQQLRASRLYLRTFGGVSLHRGDWSGPALPVEKKRVRMLLAVLAAGTKGTLTRDLAIELLWPEADPDAGINSLNQTVFQLRRYIDPGYRGGLSPEYVVSTSELVSLDRELVRTDLDEVRRMPQRLAGADWAQRQTVARRVISLVRGEFLADLRYESWSNVQQIGVHNEVRELLLPIASDAGTDFETQVSVLAASALISIDPYDEEAVIALARCLARSGRRVAARDLVIDYVRRLQSEIDDELSSSLLQAADSVGAGARINAYLTQP